MPTEIVMPQMGAEMEEGTVLRWLKQPGDAVAKGDIIAEIETDKATVEMDSYDAGTFLKAVVAEGTTVPVGQVIAYLGAAGENVPDAMPPPNGMNAAGAPASAPTAQTDGASGPQTAAATGEQGDSRAQDAERATVTAATVSESMRAERTTNAADTTDPARPQDTAAQAPTSGNGAAEPATSSLRAEAAAAAPMDGQRDSLRSAGRRLRVSPVARSMAEEMGVDLARVTGSGPEGRVTRRDVEEYARSRASSQVQGEEARAAATPEPTPPPRPIAPQAQATPRPAQPAPVATPPSGPTASTAATAAPPSPEPEAAPEDELAPLTRMRQAIARRMATAKREMPHYYVAVSVDMSAAMTMRADLNAQVGEAEKISVSHMILKACALAIEHHPSFNATFTDAGITVHHQINIGLAVALEDGLVVPAVLDCRGKSIGAIAKTSRDVAERARGGRLRPAELNDGTFTVSNLGMYGVETLIAIIQPGQSAILGVGLVEDRAVVRDGQVVPRQMMTIALSADHRVTDGAQGAQFIAEIKMLLENPVRLVL